jgi:copper homeostasis protein CutC
MSRQDHMKLAEQGAKRILTSSRPKQTARTILKHLLAYVRKGGR